jgi:hypothetical protein
LDSTKKKFDDVQALEDVTEKILSHARVRLISKRERCRRFGSRVEPPGGVLLYGSEGCGKTLVCRAIAHELASRWALTGGGERDVGGCCHAEIVECRALMRQSEQESTSGMMKVGIVSVCVCVRVCVCVLNVCVERERTRLYCRDDQDTRDT